MQRAEFGDEVEGAVLIGQRLGVALDQFVFRKAFLMAYGPEWFRRFDPDDPDRGFPGLDRDQPPPRPRADIKNRADMQWRQQSPERRQGEVMLIERIRMHAVVGFRRSGIIVP